MREIEMTSTDFQLDPVLDVRAAAPLRDSLLERRGMPLLVDASRVEQLSALCLQVLLAARQAWMHDHTDFAITARSAFFQRSLDAFGAGGAFSPTSGTE